MRTRFQLKGRLGSGAWAGPAIAGVFGGRGQRSRSGWRRKNNTLTCVPTGVTNMGAPAEPAAGRFWHLRWASLQRARSPWNRSRPRIVVPPHAEHGTQQLRRRPKTGPGRPPLTKSRVNFYSDSRFRAEQVRRIPEVACALALILMCGRYRCGILDQPGVGTSDNRHAALM